jgi:hypothetical protein
MFFNTNNDYDLLPRTYSIKGYRRRESFLAKRIFKYTIYLSILLFIAVVVIVFFIK